MLHYYPIFESKHWYYSIYLHLEDFLIRKMSLKYLRIEYSIMSLNYYLRFDFEWFVIC